jgi:hypothetical protein
MQAIAWNLLLAIFTCSPIWKKTSGAKTSVLINKSSLQYASGFRRKRKASLKMEFKSFANWQKCFEVGGDYVEE